MPLKTPIPWAGKPQLIERDGTATPYFQRILDQIMTDAASVQDLTDAQLLQTGANFTGFIPPDAVRDIALLASSMVPRVMPPQASSSDSSCVIPVASGAEPLTFLSFGDGRPVLLPYNPPT